MKANTLIKQSINIESVYERIINETNNGHCKAYYPHFVYIDESIKLQLIEDGFKVYKGVWDGVMVDCLIIEW